MYQEKRNVSQYFKCCSVNEILDLFCVIMSGINV